jgi:hypothetical protein
MNKWIIKKGKHYSLSNFWTRLNLKFKDRTVKYEFSLDSSCWFPNTNDDDWDINKLFGFSYGMHHTDSTRIGWRPYFDTENKFDLFIYNYNNKVRSITFLGSIMAGDIYSIEISPLRSGSSIVYTLNHVFEGKINSIKIPFKFPKIKLGYWLWFYFGGNNTCSHNIFALIGKIR